LGIHNQRRVPELYPRYVPLMLWGYLQYRLCGRYRSRHGGGGPGLESPPERLVTTGPYAYTRNPMYLGHIIFLIGLTLTLKSWLAAMITAGVAIWFHRRVVSDEKELAQTLGQPYIEYTQSVSVGFRTLLGGYEEVPGFWFNFEPKLKRARQASAAAWSVFPRSRNIHL
jgi:hypothetical protein